MCGINVIYGLKKPVGVADLARMCSVTQHRGPDDAGFAVVDEGRVGLAHVRLSVVDIEGGAQPLFDASGEVGVVYNGEIYDHAELRRDLEAEGQVFASRSDTEVILRAYLAWGTGMFDRLNGEFAFVLWDGRQRRLIAARDYAGVKPLFYRKTEDEVVFSSEAKGIFALGRGPRKISRDYLTGPLFGVFSRAISTFEGITSLAPGHYMVVDARGVGREQPYFRHAYRVDAGMSFEEATDGVRQRVRRAVRRRLVADVPVHAYLSGGLDSTIIAGLMADAGRDFTAYSIAFGGTAYDESSRARRVAEHYGARFERLDCDMSDLAAHLEQALFHTETGIANPGSVAKMLLSERVRATGQKVCLTGEGADELYAGYPYFKLEALWRMQRAGGAEARRAAGLLRRFRAMEGRSEGIHWNRKTPRAGGVEAFGYPSFLESRAREYGRLIPRIFDTAALGIGEDDVPSAHFARNFDAAWMRTLHPLHASREMTFNQLYGYMIPNLADRVEMANSIECRTPFLDRDLLEHSFTIPAEHLLDIDSLREKRVLHAAFAADLPPFQRDEHKHPFMSPDWRALARTPRGRELVAAHLSPEAVRRARIFDPRFVAVARVLWTTLPQASSLRKKIDALMGLVLCVQILDARFVQRGIQGDARFPLVDRTPRAREQAVA